MNRREFILTTSAATAGILAGCTTWEHDGQMEFKNRREQLRQQMAELETQSGGRLGVWFFEHKSNMRRFGYRAQEKFPMCSTFKFLAAAAILARVDQGKEQLDRRVPVVKSELVTYSPIIEKHVDSTITIAEICEVAVTLSDNTAANLMLRYLDGPGGLTRFLQSVYPSETRLDRMEPQLNEAAPGDARDTTTPAAMGSYMQVFLLENYLKPDTKKLLQQWMFDCKTGDARIRAGLPRGWKTGDKTGTGENGTSNDIAIAYPPNGNPVVICIYLTGSRKSGDERNAIIAEATRRIMSMIL